MVGYPLQGSGSGGGGSFPSDHSKLTNLEYETSGHTGFQAEDSDLTAIAALTTTGFVKRNGSASFTTEYPTIDINGLTEKTSLSYNDIFVIGDSDSSYVNKKTKFETLLKIPTIGTATVDNLIEYIDAIGFSGRITGGLITDAGSGNCSISSGTGLIRDSSGNIKSFDWATNGTVSLTNNSVNYVCMSYNSGTPAVVVYTDRSLITWNDIFPLGRVYRNGTALSIVNSGIDVDNFAGRVHDRDLQVDGFAQG